MRCSARRQAETAAGRLQQLTAGLIELAGLVQLATTEPMVGHAGACQLALTRPLDPLANHRRWLAVATRPAQQRFIRRAWDIDMQVDAIQQRPGDTLAAARHLLCGALTAPARVPEITTGTGLRCLVAKGHPSRKKAQSPRLS